MIKNLSSPLNFLLYILLVGPKSFLTKSTNKFFNPPLSRHKNTILSAQKPPCGTLFRLKIQFYCPENPCGTTCCYSQTEIYDIGTEILCKTCFGNNSTQNERKSMFFLRIFTDFYVDSESAIKTRFRARFKKLPSWIRCYRFS